MRFIAQGRAGNQELGRSAWDSGALLGADAASQEMFVGAPQATVKNYGFQKRGSEEDEIANAGALPRQPAPDPV
eukprot:4077556-Pyramimonas_sp.AAC.1